MMQIHHDINSLPPFKNAILTIGSFDGIHVGHQKIIKRLNTLAKEHNGESVVITFDPHPRSIIYPKANDLEILSDINEKIRLFKKYGVNHLVIVPFSIEFSQQTPQEYVEKFLLGSFNPRFIVIGYDHKFGLNRNGDINLLREYNSKDQLEIIQIEKEELDAIAVSSSKIRIAIKDGDILLANQYLGHPYSLHGQVIHGKKLGSTIQFPTANLKIEEKNKLLPEDGVYAIRAEIEDIKFDGMMYIGNPKTSDGLKSFKDIEVNLFNFDQNIYNEHLLIEVVDFIRENRAFDSLDLLKLQLQKDKKRSQDILKKPRTNSFLNVAILNYNGQEYLEGFLPSVLKSYSKNFTISVIDNASTDDSSEYISTWHPEINLIQLNENFGYAGGYNKALESIKDKYTVILNSDVEVDENWLDPIISEMEKDPMIACAQPKIRSLESKNSFEYAGAAGGLLDKLGYPLCMGRIFDTIEEDNGQYDEVREIFWCSGAAMVVRTKLFKKLGGFDEDFFAHQEEIDFCWRVKRAGFKCVTVPDSIVYHLGGGTLNYGSSKKIFLNFRNNLNMLLKNESRAKLFWLFPLRLMLDGVAGIKFLLSGNFSSTIAILKAHFAVYFDLFKTRSKRKYCSRLIKEFNANSNHKSGRLNAAIIWQYYFLKKKTYKEINIE